MNTKEIAGRALDKACSYTWTTLNYEQVHELLAVHAQMIIEEYTKTLQEKESK